MRGKEKNHYDRPRHRASFSFQFPRQTETQLDYLLQKLGLMKKYLHEFDAFHFEIYEEKVSGR